MKRIGLVSLLILFLSPTILPQSLNISSIKDSIKVFISEAVYERMVYWETQLEKRDSSLTETKRDGMATYESKYRGNSNWERDSISALLLSHSWDSCNAQVFTPLADAFTDQKENNNFNIQSIINIDVGAAFSRSNNYQDLNNKYIPKQQNVESISDRAPMYGNQDSGVRPNHEFNTSIPILKRFKTVFLKVFLWIFLVIGIILFGRWILNNPRSQRKENKERGKQYNTTDSIQGCIESNRELREQVLSLERENLNFKSKNEKLEREVNQLKSIKPPRNDPSDTDQTNMEGIEISDQYSQVNIEYYDSHDKGVFYKSMSKNKDTGEVIFKIEVNNSSGDLDLLTGRMDSILIADKDVFLENVCDITTLPGGNGDKIMIVKPGKVELQGDTWVIHTKIQIKIQ